MGQTSPLACEKCPDFDRLLNTGHDWPVVNITDCPQVEGIYIQHISVRCNFTSNLNIQTACAVRNSAISLLVVN